MTTYSLLRNPNLVVAPNFESIPFPIVSMGTPTAIVCDSNVDRLHPSLRQTLTETCDCVFFETVPDHEPKAASIQDLAFRAMRANPKAVVSVGGGSTIDTGKGLCAIGSKDYILPKCFQSPGRFENAMTHVVVVTTSGPGAEASPAMVYGFDSEARTAVVDDRLIPKTVVVLPPLLASLPRFNTACCVLDGIVHSFESLVSGLNRHFAHPLAIAALRVFLEGLPKVLEKPGDLDLREQLAVASILSSTGLRATGAGAAHTLGATLALMIDCPHGALVAACLLTLLRKDVECSDACVRLNAIARDLGFDRFAEILNLLDKIFQKHVLSGLQVSCRSPYDAPSFPNGDSVDPRLSRHLTRIDHERARLTLETVLSVFGL